MKKVKIKIVQPIKIYWRCPDCNRDNFDERYSAPGITRVQCAFCGHLFIAER